jgi:hypothetical protein
LSHHCCKTPSKIYNFIINYNKLWNFFDNGIYFAQKAMNMSIYKEMQALLLPFNRDLMILGEATAKTKPTIGDRDIKKDLDTFWRSDHATSRGLLVNRYWLFVKPFKANERKDENQGISPVWLKRLVPVTEQWRTFHEEISDSQRNKDDQRG